MRKIRLLATLTILAFSPLLQAQNAQRQKPAGFDLAAD